MYIESKPILIRSHLVDKAGNSAGWCYVDHGLYKGQYFCWHKRDERVVSVLNDYSERVWVRQARVR